MWFHTFKALVENMTGKKIKILRTDNGTEYETYEFKNFCREAGIKRETTTVYTPEQNGVVERKNRTIVEVVCAMLCTYKINARIPLWTPKLPKRFSLVRNLTSHTLEFLDV